MLLALDVGNTQMFGGVFQGEEIQLRFRHTSKTVLSSDQYGIFFRQVLRENNIDPALIHHVVISSVVPNLNHSLSSACIKYFNQRPIFLQAGLKTGLKIKVVNPQAVGADLIADAIAATHFFPNENLLIVDCGTANTFSAVSAGKEFLGVAIVPGLGLAVEALQQGTAQLPSVEIKQVNCAVGRHTTESIQSGIFHQAVGMVKEMVHQLKTHDFKGQSVRVVGTGGLGGLLHSAGVFDVYEPDLILQGLRLVFEMNKA